MATEGALAGLFTINENGETVVFSQGNLQYKASTNTWRFAENQYDIVGADNTYISDYNDSWIDLFGWGTGNAPTKSVSWDDEEYTTFVDWGNNAISNGGNMVNTWRTLTKDEWTYLFEERENASSLYGYANINGINGVVILPDNWERPSEVYLITGSDYSYNSYTLDDWSIMESSGAVFLPAAGYREETDVYVYNTDGDYWSSTTGDGMHSAYGVDFENYNFNAQYYYGDLFRGRSVRLVKSTCLVASGSCGDNLTWELSCDGVLSICGSGAMWENMWEAVGNSSPWSEYSEQISALSIGTGVTYINEEAFFIEIRAIYFSGSLEDWCNKPWQPVASNYDLYISGEKIVDLVIPGGVTRIGDGAFSGCSSIRSLSIPSTITEWGYNSFNCENLNAIYISDLAQWCQIRCTDFMDNPLHKAKHLFLNGIEITGQLVIPNTIDSIGNWAFVNCEGITSVVIPEGIVSIGRGSLNTCVNMTQVSFPNSLTKIGWASFLGCESLQNVVVPNNVVSIEGYAFKNCYEMESITFGDSLKEIGSWSFTSCTSLKKIVFGNNLQKIGDIAFGYDSSLTSIEIPASVISIGEVAFYDCTGLNSIICHATTPPTLGENVFYNVDKNIPLYVPTTSLELYRVADQWKDFTNIQGLTPESPTHQNGLLNGEFSIGSDKKIRFSQGNLQYNAALGSHQCADGSTKQGCWRFAEHQWDYVGDEINGTVYVNDVKCNNELISSSYDGWIDLFGWGTSGWNSGANAYQPYSTSTNYLDYYPGSYVNNNLAGVYENADWGVYNEISAATDGSWRILTYYEWQYLLLERENASAKFGMAKVNSVVGCIFLPDSWELPNGIVFVAGIEDETVNNYSSSEWLLMEQNGAVFLPAAGHRYSGNGKPINWASINLFYWTSTHAKFNTAWRFCRNENGINFDGGGRNSGSSVRLVQVSEKPSTPTAIEDVDESVSKYGSSRKVVSNGQILIMRGDKTYTITGQEVK